MTRVKAGFSRHRHHKKILETAKGYRGSRSKLFHRAKEAYLHAGEYAFAGRKKKKGDFRRLWIQRINAGLKPFNLRYSVFIDLLIKRKIDVDRKILALLAVEQPEAFTAIVRLASAA